MSSILCAPSMGMYFWSEIVHGLCTLGFQLGMFQNEKLFYYYN